MAKKPLEVLFKGFEVDGVMYPPDHPPAVIIQQVVKAVKTVLSKPQGPTG